MLIVRRVVLPAMFLLAIVGLYNRPSRAQTNKQDVAIYVSAAEGNDGWSGRYPHQKLNSDDGPVKSLYGAELSYGKISHTVKISSVQIYLSSGVYNGFLTDIPAGAVTVHLASGAVIRNFNPKWHVAGRWDSQPLSSAAKMPNVTPTTAVAAPAPAAPVPTMSAPVATQPAENQQLTSYTTDNPEKASAQHFVFAHYMVCYPDYNDGVAGFEHDIKDAQSAGVDGFALNVGSWTTGNYQKNVSQMFEAANDLNTGFKLFFSADMTGLKPPDVITMTEAYADDPSYFKYHGKAVLSTWGGETRDGSDATIARWQGVLDALSAAGHPIFFIPFLFAQNPPGTGFDTGTPTKDLIEANYEQTWKPIIDGYFYPATAHVPKDLLATDRAYADVMHSHDKLFMASLSPQYWGSRQVTSGRRYYEYDGGEGMESQWREIMQDKADWVELFTWNDFTESTYFSPIDDPEKHFPYYGEPTDFFMTHAGALDLCSYFIQWYKTGVQPNPPHNADSVYCFYRTQPLSMTALADPKGPVTGLSGDTDDSIYITTILPSPATIVVNSGTTTTRLPVGKGLINMRVPFSVGPQSISLIRNNKDLLDLNGHPINAQTDRYDFTYYSMSGHD